MIHITQSFKLLYQTNQCKNFDWSIFNLVSKYSGEQSDQSKFEAVTKTEDLGCLPFDRLNKVL